MVKIQRCKRHGVCNCCGRKQEDAEIWEIRASVTGQGWTTVMFCWKCLLNLYADMGTITWNK